MPEFGQTTGESHIRFSSKTMAKLGCSVEAVNRLAVYVTVKGDMQMALARLASLALTFVQPKESDS
jgi:hypothetical protein